MFYQYNPFGNQWGHMSWGHVVSNNLVYWQTLGVAIPEYNNTSIFSGSAVIDTKNTTGWMPESGKPPMVAFYTGQTTYGNTTKQDQRIAYSLDGINFVQYEGNPVIDEDLKDFRDPKVMWFEPDQKWVMTVSYATERQVGFFESKDLKEWKLMSKFAFEQWDTNIWECPDLLDFS